MSCSFTDTKACTLDEGLRGKGLLFAEDWGGKGAKKYFLTACSGPQKDDSACMEQKGVDVPKRNHDQRHICRISHLANFLVNKDKHR